MIKQTMDLHWFDLALNIDLFTKVQVFEKQRAPSWQLVNINCKKRSKSCDKQLWTLKFASKWKTYVNENRGIKKSPTCSEADLVETVHISICLLFQNGKENPETKGI
jgi:hypothetical protein